MTQNTVKYQNGNNKVALKTRYIEKKYPYDCFMVSSIIQ